MKKQTKLFAILLTLALIIGVFTVSAIAANNFGYDYAADAASPVTGESYNVYATFEDIIAPYVMYKDKQGTQDFRFVKSDDNKNMQYCNGYAGKVSVQQGTDGNKYFDVQYTGNDEGSGTATSGYLMIPTGNASASPATMDTIKGYTSLAETKYSVMDFDIFFPDGEIVGSSTIIFSLRAYGALNDAGKGTRGDIKSMGYADNTGALGVSFSNSNGDIYANGNKNTASSKVKLNPDQWTHVSIIAVPTVQGEEGKQTVSAVFYVAINGIVISYYNLEAPDYETNKTKYANQDMTQVFLQDIRWNFGPMKSNARVDNIAMRTYDASYTDNTLGNALAQGIGADITGWSRNVYDPDKMPLGNTVAKIGDVAYDSFDKALAAAGANDTIVIEKDFTVATALSKAVTINLNGHTVTGLAAAGGYKLITNGDVVTVEVDPLIAYRILGDTQTPIYASQGLTAASLNLANGVTIKLMADVDLVTSTTYDEKFKADVPVATAITINKNNVTFDLNGYSLKTITWGIVDNNNGYKEYRCSTFSVSGTNFTIKSSRVGGAIYNATLKNNKSGFQGNPVVSAGSASQVVHVNFEGKNEQGETTLSIYAAQVFQCYNVASTFNINGGNYISGGAADGLGMFYLRKVANGATYTIQDAYFDGGNSVFAFGALGQNADETNANYKEENIKNPQTTVNITNCVFGPSSPASVYSFAGLTMTFDGCYFGHNVFPEKAYNNTVPGYGTDLKSTYIMKNCYFANSAVNNFDKNSFATGNNAYVVDFTKSWTIYKNTYDKSKWGDNDALTALTETTVTMNFTRVVTDEEHRPPIATIGENKYPTLADAIAAANDGATITIVMNTTESVVVNKPVTINLNGYTVTSITPDNEHEIETDGDTIIIKKAAAPLTVIWKGCPCGCIESITTTVKADENIYASYKAATGKDPVCKGYASGATYYTFAGFEDESGLILDFDENSVATIEHSGRYITLAPIYEQDAIIAIRIDKNGNESYIRASQGFNGDSLRLNEDGLTIKLMANVEVLTAISVSKTVTLDLNGYRIATVTVLDESIATSKGRVNTFQVTAGTFTIKSSREGGAIFNGTLNETGKRYQGYSVISAGGASTVVNFIGRDEVTGKTTLSIYAAMIFEAQSSAAKFNIDGGNYVGYNIADSSGLFFARHTAANYTIENAYFDGGNAVFAFAGVNKPTSTCTVTVNNCVFGTSKPVSANTFDNLQVTFNNCYIGGKITPSAHASANAPSDAAQTHILNNCYIQDGVTINATYATGNQAYAVNITQDFTVIRNTWDYTNHKNLEALLAVAPTTMTLNLTTYVADDEHRPIAAQIGDTKYSTIEEALEAAESGATVTLLANVSDITLDKLVTINLNGFTASNVTAAAGFTLTNDGDTIVTAVDPIIAYRITSASTQSAIYASQGFNGSSLGLSAGVTIKLMADITLENTISVNKENVTIDLNGHKIVYLSVGVTATTIDSVKYEDTRKPIFSVTANNFTLTSSVEGGAIYNATLNPSDKRIQGGPVVRGDANNINVNFIGQVNGVTTMSIYAAQAFQAYTYATQFTVDGGHYIGAGAADSTGLFYARRTAATYTIRNAYFEGGNGALCFAGANKPDSCIVTVENCVFATTVSTYTFAGLQITLDDCYIGGRFNPETVLSHKDSNTNETVYDANIPADMKSTYIVKNCYLKEQNNISGAIITNCTIADGNKAYTIDLDMSWTIKTNTFDKNNWGDVAAQLALADKNVEMHFVTFVADSEHSPTIAKIGDVKYSTLEEAIAAATNGAVIEMFMNSTANVVIDKVITINLNGFTVTGLSAAGGYDFVTENGTITVKVIYVANVGGVDYRTLAEAIAAAADGATITMIGNSTASTVIGKPLTINLNGFTLTGITYTNDYCQSITSTAEQIFVKKAIFMVTKNSGVTYTDDSLYNVLSSITNSPATKVTLLQDVYDYTSTATINVKRSFTLDLNGKTLNIVQTLEKTSDFTLQQLSATSFPTFTVTNGTINVSNTHANNGGSTYPVFTMGTGAATLKLTYLTVNSGPLVYNYNNTSNPTVVLEDSAFNMITTGKNTTGGLVESRANITVTANRCKFYAQSTFLITSMSFRGGNDKTKLSSTFTFNNCDVYSTYTSNFYAYVNETKTAIKTANCIIGPANGYTKIYFNGCNLHGSITPAMDANDKESGNTLGIEPKFDTVVLGEGTTLSFGSSCNAIPTAGLVLYHSKSSTYKFTIDGLYSLNYTVGTTLVQENQVGAYRFKSELNGSNAYYASDFELADAITAVASGSTLYVYEDLYILTPAEQKFYATINKALTVDFLYHKVYFSQSMNGYSSIAIQTTEEVIIRNATFVYNVNATYIGDRTDKVAQDSSYAMFKANTNNINVTFNNVNAYGGTFIHSYNYTGAVVNFNGGEYHLNKTADLYGTALVESRANITVNAYNITVRFYHNNYTTDSSGVVILTHVYETGTPNSSAYFENCVILGISEKDNILPVLNSATNVEFNDCKIFGSIEPAMRSGDKNVDVPVYNSVVISGNTMLASTSLAYGIVVAEDGRILTYVNSTSVTLALNVSIGSIYNLDVNDVENLEFAINSTNLIYSFDRIVGDRPPENFTVTWYKEDGKTVILIQTVVDGTVGVSAPMYNTESDNNGWYKTGFDGWTNVKGGAKVDLATFVVTANVDFYPAEKTDSTPTPYLSAAEYNLTLTGNITLNFYLPTAPEGVNVIGVYDFYTGKEIVGSEVIIPNGQFRMMYIINTVGAIELTESSKIYVVFTVDYNDETIELTQNVTISPYKYAKSILADSEKATPTQSRATHTLVADMVRYSNTLSKTVTGNTVADLDTLLTKYDDLCSELPSDNDFAQYNTSLAELVGHVHSVSFEVSEYQPRWVFTFTEAMKIVDVEISLEGYYPLADKNGINFGPMSYKLDTSESEYANGYLTCAYMESIPMYNIDRVITITVTDADGNEYTGAYSLNVYYTNLSATGETLTNVRNFLKTFRAFGITSAGYRYPNGANQDGKPNYDFFECDHISALDATWDAQSGRYCADCQTNVFFYNDYINTIASAGYSYGGKTYASRDEAYAGKVNSYKAIDLCHDFANKYYAQGNKVGCVAGSYAFYLGEAEKYDGSTGTIAVYTDTDWSGAYFIVDDRDFGINDKTYQSHTFSILGTATDAAGVTYESNSGKDITSALAAALKKQSGDIILQPGDTNIGWSCGVPMMIEIIDYSQGRYHRSGTNESLTSTREVILIDEFGNINPSTPIEWDYVYITDWDGVTADTILKEENKWVRKACSFSAKAFPISNEPIRVSGADHASGEVNCTFETLPNETTIDISEYNACNRGILVKTSNVTIDGLKHIMNEDNTKDTPRQAYAGFIRVDHANNTIIKNVIVDAPLAHYDTTNNGLLGSYEFSGIDAVNTSWIDCKSVDFFNEDGSVTYGGLFGTNRMRNSLLSGCTINSFDSHSGAYNVTIENSSLKHMNFIGQGDIIIKNVAVYVDSGTGFGAIILRADYGSRWEGNVYFDGVDIRHSASDYDKHYIDLVKAEYMNNDYSYDDKTNTSGNYLPFEIHAKNVTIHSYTRTEQEYTATNGIIDETLTKSDKALGIYSYYDSTLKSKKYNSSNDNNKQKPTTAIYLEGGHIDNIADLCTPNNAYFSNMKIYINGVQQNWYACSGTHTDKNNDHKCDTCMARINCTASHSANLSGKCSTCGAAVETSCVTGDTLVKLADGSEKRIDEITTEDVLLVWDFFNGEYASVPAAIIFRHEAANNNIIKLTFNDGTVIKVVNRHLFLNAETNEFVYVDKDSVEGLVGTEFVKMTDDGYTTVELVDYEVYTEYIEAYGIISGLHYNIITEGLISQDFETADEQLFNCLELGDDMKYDAEKLAADIETYGLYTYEEFSDYLTYEQFVAFNVQYMKIAVGKGYYTYDMIINLIEVYLNA